MEGLSGSLRLGWEALLLKEEAFEKMRSAANPVTKGLTLIIVVGLFIAVLGIVGTVLEWASTPDLGEIQKVVLSYLTQMPWWEEVARANPDFAPIFQEWYERGWQFFPSMFGAPSAWGAFLNIIFTPVRLIIYWVLYSILAYIFARWLGGTADFSQTMGVLALAVAPQILNALGLLPYIELGSLVSIWSILCAYVGLKVAHKLTWGEALLATLSPYLLVILAFLPAACCGSLAILAAVA